MTLVLPSASLGGRQEAVKGAEHASYDRGNLNTTYGRKYKDRLNITYKDQAVILDTRVVINGSCRNG